MAHPTRVAAGQVIVDGDDMDALAEERVQIDGKRRHEGLAFAGLHFRYAALVLHHAADQLHIEMALAERAPGRLAHRGESRNQQILQRLAVGDLLPEHGGAAPQCLVAQRFHFRLKGIDRGHGPAILHDLPVVVRAENPCGNTAQSEHLIHSFREGLKTPASRRFLVKLWGGSNLHQRYKWRDRLRLRVFNVLLPRNRAFITAPASCNPAAPGPMCSPICGAPASAAGAYSCLL